MQVPSLLYASPPVTSALQLYLFEDLQLTQLMPSCPFDAALYPCDRKELPHRQRMFASLEDSVFRAHLADLLSSVRQIRLLYEGRAAATCDAERQVIHAALMRQLLAFARIAADDEGEGLLRERFCTFFRDWLNREDVERLAADTERLSPCFDVIAPYRMTFHGKQITLRAGKQTSFLARIQRCNRDLGLQQPQIKPLRPRVLSPRILSACAELYPEEFAAFAAYYEAHADAFSPAVLECEGALSFYLEMADMLERVRQVGIPLTYPTLIEQRRIDILQAYDVSLLAKNVTAIVPNDILFDESEPFFYLTGANGGGKTTYLRTVGIACVLALLGAPIPAASATLCLPSAVFTHFPHDERFDGSGRFVEEHRRVEQILQSADRDALILLNETYSTTNEENAVRMTVSLAETILERGNFGLYITHQHALGKTEIPYLNVLVDLSDNNRRTYKIVRRRGSGGSFAEDILRKYGLTLSDLRRRFGGDT